MPPGGAPETVVVAYEPVWAIGTGLTPTPADVAEMHKAIRDLLGEIYGAAGAKIRILYGGSVKPANAGAAGDSTMSTGRWSAGRV